MTTTLGPRTITASTSEEAERLLNLLEREFQSLACQDPRRGIMVTKIGPGLFSVELSEHVPYGLTRESGT